jgi:hypothetical protein
METARARCYPCLPEVLEHTVLAGSLLQQRNIKNEEHDYENNRVNGIIIVSFDVILTGRGTSVSRKGE